MYDAHFSKNLRFDGQHWRVPVPLLLAPLRRSTSDLIQSITGKKDSPSMSVQQHQPPPPATTESEESGGTMTAVDEEIQPEYDEIDQIYDYIRGFAPLPKSVRDQATKSSDHRRNLYNSSKHKPVPPPVETIPKKEADKTEWQQPHHPVTITVNRPSSPGPAHKPRMFRQRSAMPSSQQRLYTKHQQQQRPSMSPAESKQSLTPSPLFNIRYKSMTNLAADSDTLGSSQSGGRCSGGSAGSAAVRAPTSVPAYVRQTSTPSPRHLPQPRLFQLHRPKSLTDLLWGRSGDHHQRPLKIQLHPTVVADVIPRSSPSSHNNNRRRQSGTNLLLNGHHHKKHTIFYHL